MMAIERRIRTRMMLGSGCMLLIAALAYIQILFAPITPLIPLNLWVGLTALTVIARLIAGWCGWRRAGFAASVSLSLAVASSMWVILPYASEPLQLVVLVFLASVISCQLLATDDPPWLAAIGIFLVFGAASWFFLTSPGIYALPLAIFLLAFACLILGVATALRQAVTDAERLAMEATEARVARTRFIAAATHDLRQPLQASMLLADRVEGRAAAPLCLALGEASMMIESMLDHLRIDADQVRPVTDRIDLHGVAGDLIAEVAPLAASADVGLRLAAAGDVHVLADRHLVGRILRNLLHNAIRHARARHVLLAVRRRNDRIELWVLDDGRGVPRTMQNRLFDDFSAGGDSAGMGIGLAAARRMARLMGGDVTHAPRWRRGAAFRLILPAVPIRERPPALLSRQVRR